MPVQAPLSPVDPLVTSIYEGVLEDRPWRSFLHHLRTRTDSEMASLSLRAGGQGVEPIVLLDRRYEITKADALQKAEQYTRLVDSDPVGVELTAPGHILHLRDVADDDTLAQNEFYRVLMKPANVRHYVGMCFAEARGWKCLIRLMNRPDKPDYGAGDEALLRDLLPHLENALTIFAELRRTRSELREFRDSLNRLTIGVLVLDSSGRTVDYNEIARRFCGDDPTVSSLRQSIAAGNEVSRKQFDELVAQALEWIVRENDVPFVESMRIETADGRKLGLLIRSLRKLDRYVGSTSPAIVIYVSDTSAPLEVHEDFIGELFGLTAAEARLASLLAGGKSLSEAAAILNITENTVRGYSKVIYSKIGVNRQADLVRLVLKSVAIFA